MQNRNHIKETRCSKETYAMSKGMMTACSTYVRHVQPAYQSCISQERFTVCYQKRHIKLFSLRSTHKGNLLAIMHSGEIKYTTVSHK